MDSVNIPLICRICGRPVTVAMCTVDDNGKAVHEECYEQKLLTRSDEPSILPRRNEKDGMASLHSFNKRDNDIQG